MSDARWFVVILGLSACGGPPATPAVEVKAAPGPAKAAPAVVKDEPAKAEPAVVKDCLEPADGLPREDGRTWRLVGTGDGLDLHGIDGAVVVTAKRGAYVVAAGEELRDDAGRRKGLTKRTVMAAEGRWPDDAWVLSDEGEDTSVAGSQPPSKFFVWRWQGDQWSRPVPEHISEDPQYVQERVLWRAGELLFPTCEGGTMKYVRYSGDEASPPGLTFPKEAIWCPKTFHLPGRGELLGVFTIHDKGRELRTARWCATCSEPVLAEHPLKRCGTDIDVVHVGEAMAQRGDRVVLAYSTSDRAEDGSWRGSEDFVVTLDGDSVRGELLPLQADDMGVATMSLAPGGDLWVGGGKRLLRRAPSGGWTEVAGPPVGERIDRVVALTDDDVWVLVDGEPDTLYRSGAQAQALDLDRGAAKK